jgi:putative DNA primase/helicase
LGSSFAFDADAAINPNVNWAQRKLGHQLLKFNVPVYVATGNWEMGTEGETKGMDDLIQRKGIEAFRKALSAATDFKTWESKTFGSDGGDGTGKYLVPKIRLSRFTAGKLYFHKTGLFQMAAHFSKTAALTGN